VSREDKIYIRAYFLSLCCLSFDIWILASEPRHLGVLRVLAEQTLEINSVVKYPTYIDPILVTEVKYSSLTILNQIYLDTGGFYISHRFRER
jgi:hypothetical protein